MRSSRGRSSRCCSSTSTRAQRGRPTCSGRWARMRHAAAAVSRGADLSTAASDAGFASPSHFSDTFRTMFGLTATQLLSPKLRIVVMDSGRMQGRRQEE
ncbi:helix-turn-helix domain-containing protein [Nocardioides sp. NPDC047086]|uniref:helix-turn-helix domain-containing protein n=1 Tax=Nocardioides sp. NPDC047086 TaxID=3154810 RepID=UPI0033ED408D